MSDRKLASIRRIAEIRPIEGADMIVCAVIDGWQLVTQKSNNFQVGDLVVYFEIDSVLPEREEFEFLRERCYVSAQWSVNGAGFRLKTIKLKGQVSQGLILPTEVVMAPYLKVIHPETFEPGWVDEQGQMYPRDEGTDLTALLGVVKYEKPLPAQLQGLVKGTFPRFIHKTDQERIQNCYKYLKHKWNDHLWEVTMKLDGSSFTAYYNKETDEFGVCSRNMNLKETEENAYWQVARKYDLERKMREYGVSIAIQGELVGPGVQGNKEGLTELDMYVFDVFNIAAQSYEDAASRMFWTGRLGLKHVPVLDAAFNADEISLEDLLAMADGPSLNAKLREGLVFKSLNDPNVSFKAISNKWLLKTGD